MQSALQCVDSLQFAAKLTRRIEQQENYYLIRSTSSFLDGSASVFECNLRAVMKTH